MDISKRLRSTANTILSYFGVEMHRIPTLEEEEAKERKQLQWLIDMQINTVLDIGANTGQFAKHISKFFPDSMIYSFEPLPDCYEQLLNNFQYSNHFRAFNVALGDETGTLKIYHNDYSPSSSLLQMAELHKNAFPYTSNQTIKEIKIVKLDDITSQLEIKPKMLVKIDVQGFEYQVIKGGLETLKNANVLIAELSVEELYHNQKLFDDIYLFLKDLGFKYAGNYSQLKHPQDGRILQMDGIFIRDNLR